MTDYSDTHLAAYLDELLPESLLASLEDEVRNDSKLKDRLETLIKRRDAGVHSLGDVWRRQRVTCPTREDLGSYLLGILPDAEHDYVAFHVEEIGCRYCQANLSDLQSASDTEQSEACQTRVRRFFESSAGKLKSQDG